MFANAGDDDSTALLVVDEADENVVGKKVSPAVSRVISPRAFSSQSAKTLRIGVEGMQMLGLGQFFPKEQRHVHQTCILQASSHASAF